MRRISIDGIIYDTGADGVVAVCDYSRGAASDFNHVRETLYLTPAGRWFLAGTGGPQTGYAETYSDGSRGGASGIIPLDPLDARAYLENHSTAEVVERYFPTTPA